MNSKLQTLHKGVVQVQSVTQLHKAFSLLSLLGSVTIGDNNDTSQQC